MNHNGTTVIVHIVEASATGTLSMCQLLATEQAKNEGNLVYVVYSKREETPPNIECLFGEKVKMIYVNMAGFSGCMTSLLKLRKIFRWLSPDKIICHSSFAGFLGRFASVRMNLARFYIPHGISFIRTDLSFFKKSIYVLLERIANLVSCKYVACSRSEKEIIEKYLPGADVDLIENAIVFDETAQLDQSCDNEGVLRIVTIGQIRAQKDPRTFVNIARKVRAIESKVQFVWVGDGDEFYKRELLSAGIQVTGWKTKNEVLGILRHADIYLSTSLWEGLPVSVIEAQYYQVPVVVSQCRGNVDLVEEEVTGFLYSNESEAIEKLARLIRDRKLRDKVKLQARIMAADRFSIERYMENFNKLTNVVV